MILRFFLLFYLALFPFRVSAACTGEGYLDSLSPTELAKLEDAVADIPYAKGILWQASKNEKTILVVGTMHIYDPRLEPIRQQIIRDVQGADLILLEATAAEEQKLQDLLVTSPEILFITDGPTLPELLDDDTWQQIVQAASERMIPGFMAAKMQPWYLSMMLAIPPCAMSDMAQGVRGLDHMIMDDAAASGVPMRSLEPYTTLFDIFREDPFDEQIDMLRINLLPGDQQQQMFVSLLDRYFAGDVGTLWEMSRFAMASIPEMDQAEAEVLFAETEEALLVNRNINWMPVIREATELHDSIVVAVGAAHLMGEKGVLRLLEESGWNIRALD